MAVVALAATVTEVGSAKTVLLSESATVAPFAEAACDNVTVQVKLPPDVIVAGAHCRAETAICGVIVTIVVVTLPFSDAVTVTG